MFYDYITQMTILDIKLSHPFDSSKKEFMSPNFVFDRMRSPPRAQLSGHVWLHSIQFCNHYE